MGIEIVSYIGKTNAEEVRIPKIIQGQNVVGIGERAFIGKDIKRVYLPGTIQYIKRKAFSGCHQLEHISIPEGIKESVSIIEYNAFACIRPATRKTKVILLGNSMCPKELPDNIVIEHRDK